jgi:hypothetical protein
MRCWALAILNGVAILMTALPCRSASIVDVVRAAASDAIRWEAFWDGSEALGANYRPGNVIDLRVMRTQNRLYAFLSPIQIVLIVGTDGADHLIHTVGIVGQPAMSNEKAVEGFFRTQERRNTGCIDTHNAAPNPRVVSALPIARPCPPSPEGILSDETHSFTLPALTAPDAIRMKTMPPDKEALLASVRRYVESPTAICGPLKAKVPFYADSDPRVYVLLPRTGACPRGVATFSRAADSRWEFGQFFADFPKEQLSGAIAKIESNTATTVP